MAFDKSKWVEVLHSLHLSKIAPSNDEEWDAFFSKARSSRKPEKYDNLRMAIVLGMLEEEYLSADFELLCKGIEELINLSQDNEDIIACREYINIANEYVVHGQNLINFKNNERVWFAANRVIRCLLPLG
ncbi:MAG: hypothetical protein K2K85_02285 [Clostridia bacterium]|nr:hypothetical protein [Clostridia bacterium]